ncbi:MAG: hypothetical protein PUH57_03120 [Prevotellaceae bacterium]|nr:hypothetical protein [Prevotella sp.]MDD7247108.1 hypothetical protein [Prevotellaceae bacterium]MDY2749915.1 hypothetical protein [Prevotella sp.]
MSTGTPSTGITVEDDTEKKVRTEVYALSGWAISRRQPSYKTISQTDKHHDFKRLQ